VFVEPEGRYALQRSPERDAAVRLWTIERLRFGSSKPPWQKELVRRLAGEIRSLRLERAQVLRGIFVSDDRDTVDAENVLFYNLGASAFAHAPQCVRFERSWEAAPSAPVSLAGPPRYQQVYEGARAADGFRSWEVCADGMAAWSEIPCPKVVGDRAGWHIWKAMREASESINVDSGAARGAADFAISMIVRVPATRSARAMSAIKGAIDGVIASFQRFAVGDLRAREVAELLDAGLPNTSPERLLGLLTEDRGRLFWQPPFNAKGRLALNPCDDRCVAGELTVVVDPSLTVAQLSGRLARVRPAAPAAA